MRWNAQVLTRVLQHIKEPVDVCADGNVRLKYPIYIQSNISRLIRFLTIVVHSYIYSRT